MNFRLNSYLLTGLNWLFPIICVGCQREGEWLCSRCLLPIMSDYKKIGCADCGQSTIVGDYCSEHRPNHQLAGLVMVQPFHQGTLREAIHKLKYNGIQALAKPLGTLLNRRLMSYPHLWKSLLIPIPLHRTRQQYRGFNQTELIANQLTDLIPQRTDQVLFRRKTTHSQASLSHAERKNNLKNAFFLECKQVSLIKNKLILLIDDVATTTATLDEAAKVLLTAGASEVWGAVLAKG